MSSTPSPIDGGIPDTEATDAGSDDPILVALAAAKGADVPASRKLVAVGAAILSADLGDGDTITAAGVAELIGEGETLCGTHLKALAEAGYLAQVPYIEDGRARIGYRLA